MKKPEIIQTINTLCEMIHKHSNESKIEMYSIPEETMIEASKYLDTPINEMNVLSTTHRSISLTVHNLDKTSVVRVMLWQKL